MIDLTNLPKPKLLDDKYEDILKDLKERYFQATGVYPLPSYPETFLLEIIAYQHILIQELINQEGLQNLLAFARGARLDHIGALVGCERLPAQKARTTLRFTFEEHSQEIIIPAGTQVASKSGKIFSTIKTKTLQPGENIADIIAECTQTGEDGNGFVAGEINQVIEPMPYLISVENITVSSGGADEEEDDRYRLRIQMAVESFSVAGPKLAYVFHAKSAHQSICDVKVWSPSPGEVVVCPLVLEIGGGEVPSQEILNLVSEYLNDETIRPLTDHVTVQAPEKIEFSCEARLQFYENQATLADIATESGKKALENLFFSWSQRLGQDIVPEKIVELLQKQSGVYRAIVTSPLYTQLEDYQFPKCTEIRLSYEIVEEEC